MTPPPLLTLRLPDEAATQRFGAHLAAELEAGDVLLLTGDIGAGKTALARAIIQKRLSEADRLEDVPSPTFTLVQTYWDGAVEIWHADLYRLSGPDGCVELGLEDAFQTAICLVEWPDRLGPLVPNTALHVTLTVDAGRTLQASSSDPAWAQRLKQIMADD